MLTSDKFPVKLKNIVLYLISIFTGISLLVYTFRGVSLVEIQDELKNINYFYLTLFVLIILLATYIRALRWKYMILSFKKEVKLKNLFNAIVVGYGMNVIFPRFGELARALYLGVSEKISRSSALGTIIVERVIDLIFLIFSVVLSIWIFGDKLSSKYPWIYNSIYLGLLVLIISIIVLFLIIKFQSKILELIEKIFNRFNFHLFNRATEITSKVIDGFDSIKTRKNYLVIFLLSPVLWFTYALGSYISLLSLNMQLIKPVDLSSGLIIMSITTFGIIIPIPGATGSYHAFCKSVLTMILGFNVKISLTYAVLTHLISNFSVFALAVVILLKRGLRNSFLFNQTN